MAEITGVKAKGRAIQSGKRRTSGDQGPSLRELAKRASITQDELNKLKVRLDELQGMIDKMKKQS